jgi:hypothetical protein
LPAQTAITVIVIEVIDDVVFALPFRIGIWRFQYKAAPANLGARAGASAP